MSLFSYNPKTLLDAYRRGLFPTLNAAGQFILFKPKARAILPVAGMHISKTLAQTLRKDQLKITVDESFGEVVAGCVRDSENWITPELRRVYAAIHAQGWAHSVETRDANGRLVGGLYGICVGRAFFVESMFSLVSDASKVAVYHLTKICQEQGIKLIDLQMMSPHLQSLGATEVSDDQFQILLYDALHRKTDWGESLSTLLARLSSPYVETARLVIRGLDEADADRLWQCHLHDNYHRYTFVRPLRNKEQVQATIAQAMSERYPRGIPDPLAIAAKDDDRLLGTIGAFVPFAGLPQMEFAYDLHPDEWGQGYATEASQAFVDYLFGNYPILRLQARCALPNVASQRVAEKIGFFYEGTLRNAMYFQGAGHDMKYYAMTFDDWENRCKRRSENSRELPAARH